MVLGAWCIVVFLLIAWSPLRQLFLHAWNQTGRVFVVYLAQDFVRQAYPVDIPETLWREGFLAVERILVVRFQEPPIQSLGVTGKLDIVKAPIGMPRKLFPTRLSRGASIAAGG